MSNLVRPHTRHHQAVVSVLVQTPLVIANEVGAGVHESVTVGEVGFTTAKPKLKLG